MDDFEKFEEVCGLNSNQITMQSTPARANLDFNTTPPDSGRSGDTQIVHSPEKGIFRNEEEDDEDDLSWNLKPLKIDNLLPPDLDLTVEDEDKTIENIEIPENPKNTVIPEKQAN